jgi:hypothetical protein
MHDGWIDGADSVAARVEALGADEVGRRYWLLSRGGFAAHEDDWILDAIYSGEDLTELDREPLDLELRWTLVMAALEACPDDDGELWRVGDGPFDILRIEPGMEARIHRERERHPKLRRLFEAMRRELPSEGVTDGFWFE